MNLMLDTRDENVFFVYLSHRNPEREGDIKTKVLYELTPGIDAVITLPFHREPGQVTSKYHFIEQTLLLEEKYSNNHILLDNSKTNGEEWRKNGGIDIRYLPNEFDESHTLFDHMSKLVNLDPHMIQFCLSFIRYLRSNPDYSIEHLREPVKVKKL